MKRTAIKSAVGACIGFTGVLVFWALVLVSFSGGRL